MDAMAKRHEIIFINKALFNRTKRHKRGFNVIRQRVITQIPGQRGDSITMCAVISDRVTLYCHAMLRPCNTALLQFLDHMHSNIFLQQGESGKAEQAQYVVHLDDVSLHQAGLHLVR